LTAPTVTLTQAGGDTSLGSAVWQNNRWEITYTVPAGPYQGKVGYIISAVDTKGLASEDSDAILSYASSSVIIDTEDPVFPAVSVDTAHHVSGYVGEEEVTVDFTMTEANPAAPTVTFDGQTGSTVSTVGNGWQSALTVDFDDDADGILTIAISFTDPAGNSASASDPSLTSLHFDKELPSISSIVLSSDSGESGKVTDGNTVTIVFDASDNLGLTASDLSVTTTGAQSAGAVSNVSGDQWKASYTVDEADNSSGTITFTVNAADPVGNPASLTSGSLTFDNQGPAVTISSVSPSGPIVKNTVVTVVFSVNDAVFGYVENSADIDVTFDSAPVSFDVTAYNSGTHNWTVTYTPTAADGDGINITVSAVDPFNNSGNAVNSDITEVTDS